MEGTQQEQVVQVPEAQPMEIVQNSELGAVVLEAPVPQEVAPAPVAVEETAVATVVVPEIAIVPEVAVATAMAVVPEEPVVVAEKQENQEKQAVDQAPSQSESEANLSSAKKKLNARKKRAKIVTNAAATATKKKVVTGRFLDKLIKVRKAGNHSYHGALFKCARADLINADGDLRHFGCEALSQIGPFAPGTKIEVIDWVGSANLLLVSQSGKIKDTVILQLSGGSIENPTPIEP